MSDARPKAKNKRKTHTVVLKAVRVKRPTRIIRTPRIHAVSRPSAPDKGLVTSQAPQQMISTPHVVPDDPQNENTSKNRSLRPQLSVWTSARKRLRGDVGLIDRIFHPAMQYKLVPLALVMWSASIILFVVSHQLNARASYRLITLSGFVLCTSLASIYTGLLGIHHLRTAGTTPPSS